MPSDRTYTLGIYTFAAILILNALLWLTGDYTKFWFYQSMFSHLSDQALHVRYSLSVALRIVLLVIGLGLFFRIDFLRKTGLVMSVLTVLTIYWKHPPSVIKKVAANFVLPDHITSQLNIGPTELIVIAAIIIYGIDILYSILFLFYFTRPSVKKLFTQD